jgi:hypothetical protein
LLLLAAAEWRAPVGGREVTVTEEPVAAWSERAGFHLMGRKGTLVFRLSVSGPPSEMRYSQGEDAASSDISLGCGPGRTKPFLYAVFDSSAKLPSGEPVPLFSLHGGPSGPDGRHHFEGQTDKPLFLFFEPPPRCLPGDRMLILRLTIAGESRQVLLKVGPRLGAVNRGLGTVERALVRERAENECDLR